MVHIKTEIIIDAQASKVWDLLSNFSNYENWNPLIVKSVGKAEKGSRLINTLKIQDKEQVFKPKLLKVEANHKLEWLGSLFVPGIFDGRHYFQIEKLSENQIQLIHGEYFSGILSKFILKKIKDDTIKGFMAMNEALKVEAEK